MKSSIPIHLCFLAIVCAPAWSQLPSIANERQSDAVNVVDQMLLPPPLSGRPYQVLLDSEERSNYLDYGLAFSTAYSDNVLGSTGGHAVSDLSYSVWPSITLDRTSSRFHWDSTYAPGYTFYQRTTARNESDQNVSLALEYRFSPHVTFSARDTFQRSSSVFNQPGLPSAAVSAGVPVANGSIVAPLADRLNNLGSIELVYQYSANDMVGVQGSCSNLHYPNAMEVPGLGDSISQAGSGFYSRRLSHRHYLGAGYQYQRLLAYPVGLHNETQTNGVFLFYTVYPTSQVSLSFLGGPQLADTMQPANPRLALPAFTTKGWNPAGGASLDWEGHTSSAALSYSHSVADSGGLYSAVRLDSAAAAVRQQLTRTSSASLAGAYSNNVLFDPLLHGNNGHTFTATAELARTFGDHVTVALGYTRLHLSYAVPVIAGFPDTNREFISISYGFARPLGR